MTVQSIENRRTAEGLGMLPEESLLQMGSELQEIVKNPGGNFILRVQALVLRIFTLLSTISEQDSQYMHETKKLYKKVSKESAACQRSIGTIGLVFAGAALAVNLAQF